MTRGVNCLKYHPVRITGHEVTISTNSTPKTMRVAHQAIYEKDKKKEDVVALKLEIAIGGVARS